MTSFVLKIVAIAGMTANHASYVFESALLAAGTPGFAAWCALHAAGGMTFPLMAYLVVEGYRHTSNFRRYLGRLIAFALVSQVPWLLVLDCNLNVLFTLAIGLGLLKLYDEYHRTLWFWPLCIAAILASAACDWGVIGPVMVLLFRILEQEGEAAGEAEAQSPLRPTSTSDAAQPAERARRRAIVLTVGMAVLVNGLPALSLLVEGNAIALAPLLYALVGHTTAGILLCAYNGKRGRPLKWFFYAYYPAHIAALGLLAHVIA